jgi:diguanylate cyclase (GGDEF)-like protein
MVIPVSASGVILVVALFQVGSADGHLARELDLELRSLSALRSDLTQASHLVHEYATSGSADARAEYVLVAASVDRNLQVVAGFDEPDEVELGAAAAEQWEVGDAAVTRVFSAPTRAGLSLAADTVADHFAQAERRIGELDDASRADVQRSAERSARTSRLVVALAVVIGACATVINIMLVRRMLNATFSPLRHLIDGVGRFSPDDLTHRIEPVGDREFQAVGESVNAMADRLEDTFASLDHQAFHDSLTGLPNRAGLLRHLQAESTEPRSLVLFDIDDFKAVNDGLGHGAGDDALIQIGRRLTASVRPSDFIARLGGDEFVVVLEDVRIDEAVPLAEDIAAAVAHATEIHGRSVVLYASAGVAPVRPDHDPIDALRTADVALYVAKAAGKHCVRPFSPEMLRDVEGRLNMATDLREALDRGEIDVHYQPTVATGTGAVHGVEALMRWTHPRRGSVSPYSFIPVAEESGLILALGRYVLDTACAQAAAWQQLSGLEHLSVNVNVSAIQLHTPEIVADIAEALERSGLAPASLTIEVTESVMADPDAVARIHEIKALGVLIALDDFGTGYSSLSYLQRLPIDVLKIDKSFIDDIDYRADRAVLAGSIIALGRSLGMTTVAEGVERQDQLSALVAAGCDVIQGFYFGSPRPVAETEVRLLQLTAAAAPLPAPAVESYVQVSVGPLDIVAAREWLNHAHWALDQLETKRLLSGEVSSAVIALMRDYVDRWSLAAMDADVFLWVSDEDAELLGTMMSRWQRVSRALVDLAADGSFTMTPAAAGFSQSLVDSILVALAGHHEGDLPVPAGALAQHWPNRIRTSSDAA